MVKVPSVSVIIPFYGEAQLKQLNLVSKSILSQEGVDVEFIVAGLKTAIRINDLSDLSKCQNGIVPEIVRMGAIINNGLRLAKGSFIYITDADVLFLNKQYLKFLVQEYLTAEVPLKRPPMRRLFLQDFDWFYPTVFSKGLKEAIKLLDTSQEFVVKPLGTKKPMKVFSKFIDGINHLFIASESDFQEYISDENNKGSEPRYFNQDRHCGAIFASAKDIMDIGGYHEGFISWGVWDFDAQWKLENQKGIKLIPYTKYFEVIHLDHDKTYFSKSKWEDDKKLQEIRKKIGFKECINEDKKIFLNL